MGNKPKVSQNKDGSIQFEPHKNAKVFKKLYSELATNLVKRLPITPNKFNGCTTEDYYTFMFNNKRNKFQLFNVSDDVVEKTLV